MGTAKTQPTDWVWPPAPHHCFVNNNRKQWVYFLWWVFMPFTFFNPCFIAMLHFFQLNKCSPNMGTTKTQGTDWVWPPAPQHCPANNKRLGWVYLCGDSLRVIQFLWMFHSYVAIFFQLNSYGPTMGRAETQHADSVWPPTFHLCLAHNNRQRRVYF